jgi:SAM-dependent methyltransferase
VYHQRVVERFVAVADRGHGPVLDVGCGTGLVGEALAQQGPWAIDGLDLCPGMLREAETKRNRAGEPVYGSLIEADLTKPLDIATDTYGSVISAGTFTMGHVGPEAIGELARVVRPGGVLVIGVNSAFFGQRGFDRFLAVLVAEGKLGEPTITVHRAFERDDHEHSGDTAHIVVAPVIA